MNTNKYSAAARFGIYLSIPSVLVTLISGAFSISGTVSVLLWTVRFVASIWLLLIFIREWAADKESFSYGNGVSFGTLTCTFSSIIVALFSWLSIAVISSENFSAKMEETMAALESRMTAEQFEMMQGMMNNIEEITLFGTLLYCIIYGLVLSLILANFTKKDGFTIDTTTENLQ